MPLKENKTVSQGVNLAEGSLRKSIGIKSRGGNSFGSSERIGKVLKWNSHQFESGQFRRMLYRFLTDSVPIINSCIWTWVRLTAAPGKYRITGSDNTQLLESAQKRLDRLTNRLYQNPLGQRVGFGTLIPDLFLSLFRDGLFGGFLTVNRDGSAIDRFIPLDPINIEVEDKGDVPHLMLVKDKTKIDLNRPDFYFIPFSSSVSEPFGRSILQSVPFVTYVEQQLVDDMRRSSHNSGFHRLHIKITPPERQSGESDNAFTDRINSYFDSTVDMIKSLDVDDNPVTWDNVMIEHVSPGRSQDKSSNWFMTHRAMIEDICAGTHLAPYLLGYSFGATTSWSSFKFDVVMRQVRSIQEEVIQFLNWIGNIELALAGYDLRCQYQFDNSFSYQAREQVDIESGQVENILKLYQAGLLNQDEARDKVWQIL